MNPFQKTGYFLRTTGLVLLCSVSSISVAVTAHAFTAPNQITACYDCHGSPIMPGGTDIRPVDLTYRNITSGGFVGNHQRHIPATTTNAVVCTPCHGIAPTAMNHRNGVVDMRMHINSTATTVRGYYNKPVGSPAAFFNQTSLATTSSCNNVNCHFRTTTPAWGSAVLTAASDLTCGACHNSSGGSGASLMSTGSHTRHINKIGNAITTCATCHPTNATYTHATSAKIGRSISVTFATGTYTNGSYTPGTHASYPNYFGTTGYGSCTSSYCHSSVQSATGGTPPTYRVVTWGQGALTCASCHGNTAATLTTGSHSSHLLATYGFVCADCHSAAGAGTTAVHANQTINVDLTQNRGTAATYTGDGTPQNSNFGTCNTSTCHGQNSQAWGAAGPTNGVCTTCHGQFNAAYATISSAQIAPGGTGVDTGGNTAATTARVGAHQGHLLGSSNISDKMHCGECHVRPAAVQDATHLNFTTATVSFNNAWLAKQDAQTPGSAKVGGVINCSNVYCHVTNRPAGTGANQSGVATSPVPAWNNTALIGGTTLADSCSAKCHGLPPGGGVVGDTSHAGISPVVTFSGLAGCTCHNVVINTGASSFATIFSDKTKHINGTVDATGSHAFPYPGSTHMSATGATTPSTSCGCHNSTLAGPYPATTPGNAPNCMGCHKIGLLRTVATSSCYDCHGATATDGRPNGNVFPNYSGSHTRHVVTKGYVCTRCHANGGTASANHGPSNRINSTGVTFVHVSSATKELHFTATGKGVCTNSYCHSTVQAANGGAGAPTYRTVTWGGADMVCTSCHGNDAATLTTGSHTAHLNTTTHAAFTCSNCHSGYTATTVTEATHVNSVINVQQTALVGGTGAYSDAAGAPGNNFGRCTSTYCHSSVQSATGGVPTYATVTWNQGAMTCTSCHATTALTSGTHSKHLNATYGYACSDCHGTGYSASTVAAASHADQTININLAAKAGGGTAAYTGDGIPQNSNFGACNNTVCHGKNSAAWGGSVSTTLCTECHGQANFAYANISAAQIAPGGTGVDTGGNTAATTARVGAHQTHLLGSSNISDKMHCGECHVRPATVEAATHLNFTTATVSFTNADLAKRASHAPAATKVSGVVNCSNVYCHHGLRPEGTAAGQSGIATRSNPAWSNTTLIGGTSLADSCTAKCHNLPPGAGVSGDTHQGLTAVATFTGLSACSGCHSDTLNASPTTYATIFKDKNKHINGTAEAAGANCIGCHGSSKPKTKPSAGTIRQVVGAAGDFVRLSRHVSNGTATENVTKWDCIVCHREGDMNSATGAVDTALHGADSGTGLVQLRNVDTPGSGWAINNKAMTEVMRTDLDTFCLSCHDSNGAAGINVNGTNSGLNLNATRALTPWNTSDNLRNGRDGLTTRTRVIDVRTQFNAGSGGAGTGYNGNPSQHAVLGARYSTNNASWTAAAWTTHTLRNGTAMTTVRETGRLHCSDCHLNETNAHGATNAWFMLLNGTANDWTSDAANQGSGLGAPSAALTVCYKCHSSTTYGTTGTTPSRFNHNQDSGHTLANGDQPRLGVQCLNCHAGDTFGGIHGVSGTYAPATPTFPPSGTTYTRYRFLPGAWMQYKPGTAGNDTDFSTNTAGTCYFPASSTMSACTSHSGGTKSATNNYGRAVKY